MIASLLDAFRTFGLLDGSLFLFGRVCTRLTGGRCRVQKYVLVAQPVPAARIAPAARPGAVEIRSISADESRKLAWPRPDAVIERRYRHGAFCIGAFRNGQLIGFQWTVVGPYEEDDVRSRFVPVPAGRAAWDFDIWIAPEYRLGRTFLRLWDATNAMLHLRGVLWSMSRISAFAPESIRSHGKLAARRVGSSLYFIAGPLQLTVVSGPPFFHVGMCPTARPVIDVPAPDPTPAAAGVQPLSQTTPDR